MAREGSLFIGRLNKTTRTRDVESVFEAYGRMTRCEVKYGAEMAYAFIDFEDRRDAEDALKYENGKDICGSSIIVEWARGTPRSSQRRGGGSGGGGYRGDPGPRESDFRRRGSPSPRKRSRSPKRRRSSRRSRSRSRSRDRKLRRSRSRSRSRSPRSRSRSLSQ